MNIKSVHDFCGWYFNQKGSNERSNKANTIRFCSYITIIIPVCLAIVYGMTGLMGRFSKKLPPNVQEPSVRISGVAQPLLKDKPQNDRSPINQNSVNPPDSSLNAELNEVVLTSQPNQEFGTNQNSLADNTSPLDINSAVLSSPAIHLSKQPEPKIESIQDNEISNDKISELKKNIEDQIDAIFKSHSQTIPLQKAVKGIIKACENLLVEHASDEEVYRNIFLKKLPQVISQLLPKTSNEQRRSCVFNELIPILSKMILKNYTTESLINDRQTLTDGFGNRTDLSKTMITQIDIEIEKHFLSFQLSLSSIDDYLKIVSQWSATLYSSNQSFIYRCMMHALKNTEESHFSLKVKAISLAATVILTHRGEQPDSFKQLTTHYYKARYAIIKTIIDNLDCDKTTLTGVKETFLIDTHKQLISSLISGRIEFHELMLQIFANDGFSQVNFNKFINKYIPQYMGCFKTAFEEPTIKEYVYIIHSMTRCIEQLMLAINPDSPSQRALNLLTLTQSKKNLNEFLAIFGHAPLVIEVATENDATVAANLQQAEDAAATAALLDQLQNRN